MEYQIGKAITINILKMIGIRIWVREIVGRGCTFECYSIYIHISYIETGAAQNSHRDNSLAL